MNKIIIIGGDKDVAYITNHSEPMLRDINIKGIKEEDYFFVMHSRSKFLFKYIVTIMKDSKEATDFCKWLNDSNNHTEEAINRKYLEYVISNLSIDDFLNIMDKSNRDGFTEGYKRGLHIKEIRDTLGIH